MQKILTWNKCIVFAIISLFGFRKKLYESVENTYANIYGIIQLMQSALQQVESKNRKILS